MADAQTLAKRYKTILDNRGINTRLRLAHFFAQLYAESGLVPSRESLYYTSITGAKNAFKTPFRGKTDMFVQNHLRNSVKMANYVYANRMGNGNVASGDGYKYRGGGFMHHTGKAEYMILTARTGIDFTSNPDKLLEEPNAIIAAIDYWNRLGLNRYADADNLDAVSDLINIGKLTPSKGDANGYQKRLTALNNYKKIF